METKANNQQDVVRVEKIDPHTILQHETSGQAVVVRTHYPIALAGLPPVVGDFALCAQCEAAFHATGTHLSEGQLALALQIDDPYLREVVAVPQDADEVEKWVNWWMIVYLGVLSNHRPRQQLLRWCSPDVYELVSRRRALIERREQSRRSPNRRSLTATTVVKRVRLCRISDGLYEAAVIVRTGEQFAATALRVERTQDRAGNQRMRVSALEI